MLPRRNAPTFLPLLARSSIGIRELNDMVRMMEGISKSFGHNTIQTDITSFFDAKSLYCSGLFLLLNREDKSSIWDINLKCAVCQLAPPPEASLSIADPSE